MSFAGPTTFLRTTLLSILTFIMRLFARSRPRHTAAVIPYPFAPHLENCIIDIGRDTSAHTGEKAIDLNKDVFDASYNCPVAGQAIQNDAFGQNSVNKPEAAAVAHRNVSPAPVSRIVPHSVFHSAAYLSSTTKQDSPVPPLSVTDAAVPEFYWNLPTKSSGIKASPDKTNNVSRRKTDHDITPLKIESNLPGESVDWAARIRSVFYKNREGDEDLSESVRDLFNRDSASSPDHSMDIIKDGDLLDQDDYYGIGPLGVLSTCCSPSSQASSCPAPVSPLPYSGSSELPYLRDSGHASPSLSASSSASSGTFNDLLASVERKYPGRCWKDIVKFSADGPYTGIAGGEKEKQQWSDVLCIDEYAH
ncbi:hypothetical protein MVEN_01568500 [Mycena venus]|uniref:Uncharacterized protein n=1 Tax=Mycena venus TaxID=2733690 RepID=A0A8H6XSH1_9AGAR|nr:hypothetical protein MVEN_01568500 [Mycena venus]